MSIPVEIPDSDDGTMFYPYQAYFFSPNGRYCCFIINKCHGRVDGIPQELKFVQFLDLVNKSQNRFEFPDEQLLRVNSVYWLTDNLIVFLSTDGKSFTQTMYRVEIQQTPCMQKVCERVYVLSSPIFKDWKLPRVSKIIFDGEDYITWVDAFTENGSCTGLYLIPQNPINQQLKMRKFAMNFNTKTNPIFKKDDIMKEHDVSNRGRIIGAPFIRNNQLLFRICCKYFADRDNEEFEENKFIIGVFLSVNVDKLQEVKGLEYDQKEIQDNTGAYTIYAWTRLMKIWQWEFHVGKRIPIQVGKYLTLKCTSYNKHFAMVVNLEDESFTEAISVSKPGSLYQIVHPSGFVLKMEPLNNYQYSLEKINSAWNSAKLEDVARRNVILNEDMYSVSTKDYMNIIYK